MNKSAFVQALLSFMTASPYAQDHEIRQGDSPEVNVILSRQVGIETVKYMEREAEKYGYWLQAISPIESRYRPASFVLIFQPKKAIA